MEGGRTGDEEGGNGDEEGRDGDEEREDVDNEGENGHEEGRTGDKKGGTGTQETGVGNETGHTWGFLVNYILRCFEELLVEAKRDDDEERMNWRRGKWSWSGKRWGR